MAVVNEEGAYFIERVGTYPVIASTVDQVKNIYSKCKESNSLLKYSLETAESGAKLLTDRAAPVVEKLPISTVNKLAVYQLEKLEQKYPIVTKPTDEVYEETKKLYDANLKPSVDKVQAVGQYASDKYEGVKDYIYPKYEGAKDYVSSNVQGVTKYGTDKAEQLKQVGTEKLTTFLETPSGQAVVNTIDKALCYAETYVDKYLPEEKTSGPKDPVVRTRLYNRTMKELKNLQLRSQETLQNLHFTVDLIDYARTNMDKAKTTVTEKVQAAKEKGQYYWDEIQKEEKTTETDEENKTLERRAILMARNLTQHLKEGLATMTEVANQPGTIKEKLQEAVTFSNSLMWSFMKATNVEDLPEYAVSVARDQLFQIQGNMIKVSDLIASYWQLDESEKQNGEEMEMDTVCGEKSNGDSQEVNGDHQQ